MRGFIILTALTAPLVFLPAGAQYVPPPPYGESNGINLVAGWIRQFLGRGPNQGDLRSGQVIDEGTQDPEAVLTTILGCDEYYTRAGGTDPRFIHKLFRDLTGRLPTRREEQYWMYRMRVHAPEGWEGRVEVASEFLHRYPQRTRRGPPPVRDDYRYRRPYYPDYD